MIYYIGYYTCEQIMNEERKESYAAKNKMKYIISALSESLQEEVYVISAAETKKYCFVKGSYNSIGQKAFLKTFNSFNSKNKIIRGMGHLVKKIDMYYYMLKRIQKNDYVIIYHSLAFKYLIYFLKKIKKCKIILEVEEIYADVIGDFKLREKEMSFFKFADAYIFPTKLLDNEVNIYKKPSVFIHGTYQLEIDRKCNIFSDNFNDKKKQKVHCVYAGTFDPKKGGALASILSTKYLPSNYHIHILGFGSNEDKQSIIKNIDAVSKNTKAEVSYDGLLSGEEYIRFIQSCDIGLSTQNPKEAFNMTSFPSKILSYMANGLQVVSANIPVVEYSDVGQSIYYYKEQTPKEIARAILSVNLDDFSDNREIISNLDIKFKKEIKKLIESIFFDN